MADVSPQEMIRMLGLGGDPAAARPGVSVSPPGARTVVPASRLPGAGSLARGGRPFNPGIGQENAMPIPLPPPRPQMSVAPEVAVPMQTSVQGGPQAAIDAAPGPGAAATAAGGAAAPASSGLLDQLGLGGARPYLRAAAGGLNASAGDRNFMSALAHGFAGAQDVYAGQEATTAKQAREDAQNKQEQANKDREFALKEKTEKEQMAADAADRAAKNEELGWKRADRAREEEDRASGLTAANQRDDLTREEAHSTLKREDFSTDEAYMAAVQKIRDRHAKKLGLGTGDGLTLDTALKPSTKYEKQRLAEVGDLMDKEGSLAWLKPPKELGGPGLYKRVRQPDGTLAWTKTDPKAEQDAADAAAAAAKPRSWFGLGGG